MQLLSVSIVNLSFFSLFLEVNNDAKGPVISKIEYLFEN